MSLQITPKCPFILKRMEDFISLGRKADFFSQIMQQIAGINLITYYATMVFKDFVGMNAITSRMWAACNGTEYFLTAWAAYYTIKRVGRRELMIFGLLVKRQAWPFCAQHNGLLQPHDTTKVQLSPRVSSSLYLIPSSHLVG